MNTPAPIPFAPSVAELDERFAEMPWRRVPSCWDVQNVGSEEDGIDIRRSLIEGAWDALIAVGGVVLIAAVVFA